MTYRYCLVVAVSDRLQDYRIYKVNVSNSAKGRSVLESLKYYTRLYGHFFRKWDNTSASFIMRIAQEQGVYADRIITGCLSANSLLSYFKQHCKIKKPPRA